MTGKDASILDALKTARKRIEIGWCQGNFAKKADGTATHSDAPDGCSWCLMGALYASYIRTKVYDATVQAILETLKKIYPDVDMQPLVKTHSPAGFIVAYNDKVLTSQQDALKVLDNTIERLQI